MRRLAIAVMPSLALLTAACGQAGSSDNAGRPAGSTAATAQQSRDPKDVVLLAVHHASSTTFQADVSVTMSFSASGPVPGALKTIVGQSVTMRMHLDAASPQRNRVRLTISAGAASLDVTVVEYDGSLFGSSDGGKTYKTIPLSTTPTSSYGEGTALEYLQDIATVSDQGPAEVDGVQVEDYHAELDAAKFTELVRAHLSGLKGKLAGLADSVKVTGGHLDALIDAGGRVINDSGIINASMDLGAIDRSLAGVTMSFDEGVTADFHDYGEPITITSPVNVVSA